MSAGSEFPVCREVEIADPLAAARPLADLPYPFLLHSALEGERSRWSFFGAEPFAVFRGADYADAIALWRRLSAGRPARQATPAAAPFTGGVVGYWAYDFGRRLERLPSRARDDLKLPDAFLGFYDVVGACDHRTGRSWLFSSGLPLEGRARRARAEQRLGRFRRRLDAPRDLLRPQPPQGRGGPPVACTFDRDGYRRAVDRVREHIRAGDLFQANLSQRWSCSVEPAAPGERALALAAALAACSPAPYAAFLAADDHAIACASPERFLELRGRRVETRPIKGTRPRSLDPAEDRRLAAELLASGKDRAENVMIVDVLRNDLGRVSETGSIRVTGLCELETFPQVHHLTSTVTGSLRSGLDAFDLLHACFPGGSISGAPKIRAMEVLDALEPVRRHVYTGSLGYVDWRGDADWNIAIRTATVTPDAVHFAAGGGITADSDPEQEYLETLDKAEGIRRAVEQVIGRLALDPALAEVG
ncbi:MAG TPA: anthranilate synthase component I family protein [Candidatus Eisenbacteria bacterium]|jgi:para-aminobenzoate synthetase component 1